VKVTELHIHELLMIEPDVYEDKRGYFMEVYHHNRYAEIMNNTAFVQDNLSFSVKNTLRGLHFQFKHPQAKLIQVISGEVFDVAVDIRNGSPTFGKWAGEILSDQNRRQLFIPEGFAHGFCVLSETAHVLYKCTDVYYPEYDKGIVWSDPDMGIDWPIKNPLLSEKDRNLPPLSHWVSGQPDMIDMIK